jgi:urease accessory protein
LAPLGQTAGQRILSLAAAAIPAAASRGLALAEEEIGFVAQRQAIGSALHEDQYSRLFRS